MNNDIDGLLTSIGAETSLINTRVTDILLTQNYHLRGNVVSVIDARKRFGLLPMESSGLTRIIVIEVKQYIIGVMVDSVAEVKGF